MKSIFIICLFIIFYPASAQVDPDDHEPDSTTTNYLSEITISANRWEQNIREVPGKISTIQNSQIQFQNPQTSADVLGLSGNVFIQKSQLGGGSPMIRGFATNRVMLVLDGVRMNNAIFRGGNVQNAISFDANAIQETEVLFGPGSVIYGSDAIGGVMDFHTLKPAVSQTGKVQLKGNAFVRYASANREKTEHVDFNVGGRKWASITSVSHSDYDDLKMGSEGPAEYVRPEYVVRRNNEDIVMINKEQDRQVPTAYSQWNVMQKVRFDPLSLFHVTYAFHYSTTSDNPRYDRLVLKESGRLVNAEWYYGPQLWMMNSLNVGLERPSLLFDQMKLVVALQDNRESRHNRGFNSSRRTDRAENVKAFSVNVDLDKKISARSSLFYGAELVSNKVFSTAQRVNIDNGQITPASTRYPDGSRWRSMAVYVSARTELSEKWSIDPSLRFTNVYTHARFDRTFFDFPFSETLLNNNALNGALGLVFHPVESWKLYANFSTGFRAPNVDDVGKVFDSEPGNVVVPNTQIKPEYAYNGEVGFTGTAGDRVSMDFSAFYTILDNAIARGPSTFNGQDSIEYDGVRSRVMSLQNISELWVAGIQAGVNIEFDLGISFRATFNYQRGKEKLPGSNSSYPPTHVAPTFGSAHLVYRKGRFSGDLYTNYNGRIPYSKLALSERADAHLYAMDSDGRPYAPAWATVNIKLAYELGKLFTLDTGLENIYDKRYRPYSSGISAPGRNLIVSLRMKI